METTITKKCRLNIRCDIYTRQLLDKAAGYAHMSISDLAIFANSTASKLL